MTRGVSQSELGQGMILFLLMIASFLAVVSLTADIGMAYRERNNVQSAADAAALAAAGVLYDGGTTEAARAKAAEVAEQNGYVDGVDGVTVTIAVPPDSGPHAGASGFAEVEIDSSTTPAFGDIIGFDVFSVHARAVAGGTQTGTAYGIIALNPTACRSVDLNGTIDIYIRAAGLFVNSNCPTDAFWANGNVTVDTDVNAVVGGWDSQGNVTITPTPVSVAPITDPLAGLPAPAPPTNVQTCPDGSFSGTLMPGRYECTIDPSGPRSIIFSPGNYHITGGIVADGGGNIIFGAGEYTIGGVGLKVTGGGRITANEAFLYIAEGEADLTGNGETRLLAPVTGPYTGISVFQARTNTTPMNLKGNSLTAGVGVIYAPAAEISLVGTADSANMQIIADTFSMSGAASVELDLTENVPIEDSLLRLVE